MEGRFGFHGKAAVSPEFAAEALEELEARLEQQTRALHGVERGRADVPAEAKTEPTATRAAYGEALLDLGEVHEDVVALDADLAGLDPVDEVRQAPSRSGSSTAAPPRRT